MLKDCHDISNIKDLMQSYPYKEEHQSNVFTREYVECGTIGRYRELERVFTVYYKSITDDNEKKVAQAMCHCCKELKPQGDEYVTWDLFYECMSRNGIEFDEAAKALKDMLSI